MLELKELTQRKRKSGRVVEKSLTKWKGFNLLAFKFRIKPAQRKNENCENLNSKRIEIHYDPFSSTLYETNSILLSNTVIRKMGEELCAILRSTILPTKIRIQVSFECSAHNYLISTRLNCVCKLDWSTRPRSTWIINFKRPLSLKRLRIW